MNPSRISVEDVAVASALRARVGARLVRLRQRARLSQRDLSRESGVSIVSIWRIEAKGTWPSAEVAVALARTLQTTAERLLK